MRNGGMLMRIYILMLTGALLAVGAMVAAEPAKEKSYEVPYRLTLPKHLMVRAKINGKGPFNFILDTGAPALFFTEAVAARAGVKADEKGWGECERFELEGGLVIPKARGRIDTPFQLEGMNGMGLAGAEIHGLIGYNILAQYRMTIDLASDRMLWTPMAWTPERPIGFGDAGGSAAQGSLEFIGSMMKGLGGMLGRKATPAVTGRGQAGILLRDEVDGVVVASVLKGSPSDTAGVKQGDRLRKVADRSVTSSSEALDFAAKHAAGKTLALQVERSSKSIDLTINLVEGY
jgi:hypothetical protein